MKYLIGALDLKSMPKAYILKTAWRILIIFVAKDTFAKGKTFQIFSDFYLQPPGGKTWKTSKNGTFYKNCFLIFFGGQLRPWIDYMKT